MPDAPGSPLQRTVWSLLTALAALAIGLLLVLAAQRVGYPFELEWMEGAMVDHAHRVLIGRDVYVAPSPEHVPFLYTPLLYYLGALAMACGLEGFTAVRSVSILATIGCLWLLFAWVRRETGSRQAGIVAAGIFAAGYGWLQQWYDLARNDVLFLALLLACAFQLRFGGRRAAVLAGLLGGLAFLAKQTALLWLPALVVGTLLLDWRKGLLFAIAVTVAILGIVLGYHVATDGWFTFYVFDMPSGHDWQGDRKLGFWLEDLLAMQPLVLLSLAAVVQRWRGDAGGRPEPRDALWLAAFGGGALLTSYVSRLHVGGFDNVLVYAFAGGCILGPLAAHRAGGRLAVPAAVLLVLQFPLLVVDLRATFQEERLPICYDPRRCLPTAGHRKASEQYLAALLAERGPVFAPFHGFLPTLAGKGTTVHGQAFFDLWQRLQRDARAGHFSPRTQSAYDAIIGAMADATSKKRWAAIYLDEPAGVGFEAAFGHLLTGYQRRAGSPIEVPRHLQPLVGMVTHSPYVLEPKP